MPRSQIRNPQSAIRNVDVLCVGNFVADVIGKPISRLPKPGTLVHVEHMELHNGGNAMNAAIALGRLGTKVGVIGKVGDDYFADVLVKMMTDARVDCRGLIRDARLPTSATMVTVGPHGERGFLHYPGPNRTLSLSDIPWALVKRAKFLHVSGYFLMTKLDGVPTATLLQRARRAGVTTALDVSWDPKGRWFPFLRPCLPHVDYFLPNEVEAQKLSGQRRPPAMANFFQSHGVGTVVIKLGKQGCYFQNDREAGYVPGYQVKTVDTTGAGDSFCGGFFSGLARGWSLRRACQLGNATGAACVSAMGASTGIRSFRQISGYLKQRSR